MNVTLFLGASEPLLKRFCCGGSHKLFSFCVWRPVPCNVCVLFQVSERMKIVDVIGEKAYKDGERIIAQVRPGHRGKASAALSARVWELRLHGAGPACCSSSCHGGASRCARRGLTACPWLLGWVLPDCHFLFTLSFICGRQNLGKVEKLCPSPSPICACLPLPSSSLCTNLTFSVRLCPSCSHLLCRPPQSLLPFFL